MDHELPSDLDVGGEHWHGVVLNQSQLEESWLQVPIQPCMILGQHILLANLLRGGCGEDKTEMRILSCVNVTYPPHIAN